MTHDTLRAAEQALDDHIKSTSNIELASASLLRQFRIQTVVVATVGTVLAIETTTIAALRICYGL
jgi:hypothetical protein